MLYKLSYPGQMEDRDIEPEDFRPRPFTICHSNPQKNVKSMKLVLTNIVTIISDMKFQQS